MTYTFYYFIDGQPRRSRRIQARRASELTTSERNANSSPVKIGRRCESRSGSTTPKSKTNTPSNGPSHRTLFDTMVKSSKPANPKSVHRCNRRSKSASFVRDTASPSNEPVHDDSLIENIGIITPSKSNLKQAHRCNIRSKSVTFEMDIDQSSDGPVRQSLIPVDLTVQNSPSPMPNAAYADLSIGVRSNGSDVQLAYENRIKKLVENNNAMSNKITKLIAENGTLRQQIETLHRVNKSLAEKVDTQVVDVDSNQLPNGRAAATRISILENELKVLHARVGRLNRENFDL